MESPLLQLFLFGVAFGGFGSLFGYLYVRFGDPGPDLRVSNATGIGFLVGASIGTVIGIFESMIGRL